MIDNESNGINDMIVHGTSETEIAENVNSIYDQDGSDHGLPSQQRNHWCNLEDNYSASATEIADSVSSASTTSLEIERLPSARCDAGINGRRTSNTKRTFRSMRASTLGAVDASLNVAAHTNGRLGDQSSNHGSSDDFGRIGSEELSISFDAEAVRPGAIAMYGMNVEYSSMVGHNLVAAEVVDSTLDASERRRIVQETLQDISNRTVTAQVVVSDNNKSVRKYCTIFMILIGVVMAIFAVVIVLIFQLRLTSPDIAPSLSPTQYVPRDNIFRTTEELYDAVDAYIIALNALNGTDSVASSEVALRFGYPMNTWNVHLLTNFTRVFAPTRTSIHQEYAFNENLSAWDVSNAETMAGMFENSISFQGIGLENWNVSQVVDFSYMFFNSNYFNETVSKWDTSGATTMEGMFLLAIAFNDDLSLWDVSNVQSMNSMFSEAWFFEGTGLGNWNVGKVEDFSYMFLGASSFQGTISKWDTSSAETMEYILSVASSFNDNLALWDVSNVMNMNFMFSSAVSFSGNGLARWNVSKVTAMHSMFSGVLLFDEDLSFWDTSSVTDLTSMVSASITICVLVAKNYRISLAHVVCTCISKFDDAELFNRNLSAWNVSSVLTMNSMFAKATSFNGDVSTWDVSRVVDFSAMFRESTKFNGNQSAWNTNHAEYMTYMFDGAKDFHGDGLSSWGTSKVTNMDCMFHDTP
jgi:hypothetical protein